MGTGTSKLYPHEEEHISLPFTFEGSVAVVTGEIMSWLGWQ